MVRGRGAYGRKTQKRHTTIRLLHDLLEVEVVCSSKGSDLDGGREGMISIHTVYCHSVSRAPGEYRSCSGQAKDRGTSHPYPRGRTHTSSKTWPKSTSSATWPFSPPYMGAYRLPNRGTDRRRPGVGRVATTDRGRTCVGQGSTT